MASIISTGDYVVCKDPKQKKHFLVKVSRFTDGEIRGVLEKDIHLQKESITVSESNIVVNLGDDPAPGTVYGVDVRDIYRRTVSHDVWGDIHLFIRLSTTLKDYLKAALDNTGEKLVKNGFEPLFRHFLTEIRTERGKYAGNYQHGRKEANRISLYLKEEHGPHMRYVLYHEFGHVIRYNLIRTAAPYAAWVKLFNTSIPVEPIPYSDFKSMLKTMIRSEAKSVSQFGGMLEEDSEKRVFKTALRYIRQVHKLDVRAVSKLMEAQKEETLQDIWPKRDLDVNDLNPVVSEYATKNVEELFAESFAFYMTGQKLPKSVHALLEKTLSFAKDNVKTLGEATDDEEDE